MGERNRRREEAGAIHHVYDRGNGRQVIFRDEEDRRIFLGRLTSVVQKRDWAVLAYSLLGNHYHLLLETPAPDLGAGMRDLNALYARIFNRRHAQEDHLFRSPYGSQRVATRDYFVHLLRYVAFNPVKAGLCREPTAWPWSSHGSMLAGAGGPLVAANRVEELLEDGAASPCSRYARVFEAEGVPWPADRRIPGLQELLRTYPEDRALHEARWLYGYTVEQIAGAVGRCPTWVSVRTKERRPDPPWS